LTTEVFAGTVMLTVVGADPVRVMFAEGQVDVEVEVGVP
jgi:hypothetical protein